MGALDMKVRKKVQEKKCKVARLNDMHRVGARVIYNRKILDRRERLKSTDVDRPFKCSGRSKRYTTPPPQRQRESEYV